MQPSEGNNMKKMGFNVAKARKNLLGCDIAQVIISTIALLNAVIAAQFIVIPRVVTILYGIALVSLILLVKAIKNIRAYYKKQDELFQYLYIDKEIS